MKISQIINVVNHVEQDDTSTVQQLHFSDVPYTRTLLPRSPTLYVSPSTYLAFLMTRPNSLRFMIRSLSQSIMYQILFGTVLVTPNGCAKSIDFEIIWRVRGEREKGKETGAELGDICPDHCEKMYPGVSIECAQPVHTIPYAASSVFHGAYLRSEAYIHSCGRSLFQLFTLDTMAKHISSTFIMTLRFTYPLPCRRLKPFERSVILEE